MKSLAKKVVILNNFSSPYISQAIVILKNYNPELEPQIIQEAEKIVNEYLEKNSCTRKKPKTKLISILCVCSFILGLSVFAISKIV